ncbi:hypothetical protein ABNF97_08130 [Plantactinospora sp. B6F1]|uniref:hypothetical protein n=1 Tax=Plantactinospora sp. B6F1 TaxID=3158971 RepID=UPI0032D8C2FD
MTVQTVPGWVAALINNPRRKDDAAVRANACRILSPYATGLIAIGEPTARGRPGGDRLTRDQLKALWLHRAVAGRLVSDPDGVLAKAAANLERLRSVHPDGMAAKWLERWSAVLDAGVESVLTVLTSTRPDDVELRQNSPFAGVLPESERRAVLAAFAQSWREQPAVRRCSGSGAGAGGAASGGPAAGESGQHESA